MEKKEKLEVSHFQEMFGNTLKVNVHTNRKVISCNSCDGAGYTSHDELMDYHRRDYGTIHRICNKCEGSGRQVELKTYTRIDRPYPLSDIRHEDTKLIPYDPKEDNLFPSVISEGNLYLTVSEGVIR